MAIKRYGYIVWMLLCALAFTACNDDDGVDYEKLLELYGDWKTENEEAFKKVENDSQYSEIASIGNDGSVYVKVLKEGTGKEPIFYNDSVKVYYTLWTIDGKVQDKHEPPYEEPIIFGANEVVSGWTTTLQNMHVGDRWEVWIPYQLGYGISGKYDNITGTYSILPFTTLHFEIEVLSIFRNGKEITK